MSIRKIDLCNMALAHLRQRPVTADDQGNILGDTPEAANVRRFYEIAIREALRAFDWPFARSYIQGEKIPGLSLPNWRYAYKYPDKVEAIRYIVQSTNTEAPIRYSLIMARVGGDDVQAVFTNQDAAYFCCTVYGVDETKFTSDFVEFASLVLAAHIAMPITGKAELMMGMRKLADDAGKRAASTSAGDEGETLGADPDRDTPLTNTSPVEIVNLALGLLAEYPIQSFGERTKQASAARRYYATALRATLRSVDWPFARTYGPAVPVAAPALPGWAYAYEYPANCAALRGFAKQYPTDYDPRFKIAGNVIYSNRPAATLIYTRWDMEPAAFDPEFTVLFAHELAVLMVVPMNGKADAIPALQRTAKMLRDKARADAMNEEPNEVDDRVPDWLAARGIPSLTREDRERFARWGSNPRAGAWGGLPGSGAVNSTPPMITGPGPGSAILPAYIPGLTAPVEPPAPLLSSSDFWVESVGGRIERDGRLVIDDPSDRYVEPKYDVQEDN